MKIGVIADIHSNHIAFRTCIDFLVDAGCKEFFLLGDFVSDTAGAEETMQELYELMDKYPYHILRGNREEYMLSQWNVREKGYEGPRWKIGSASGNLLYTYERLAVEDFSFFEKLPNHFKYEYEDYPVITCVHGSPDRTNELLQLYEDRVKEVLHELDTDYLIAAHTHFPGQLSYEGKLYANTGSSGLSIGDPGYAHAIILCTETNLNGEHIWKVDNIRIPYDTEPVIRYMFESGLYDYAPWFINNNLHILRTGIDLTVELVETARNLKEADGEDVIWPDIEEEYFEKAAGIIGLPDYRGR